jgi:hypothetical protein
LREQHLSQYSIPAAPTIYLNLKATCTVALFPVFVNEARATCKIVKRDRGASVCMFVNVWVFCNRNSHTFSVMRLQFSYIYIYIYNVYIIYTYICKILYITCIHNIPSQ